MNILVTGGTGLVGSAIKDISKNYKYNFIFISSKDCNLEKIEELDNFFKKNNIDYVIHLAACVGGLFKNMNNPVEMFEKNILINHNILKICHKYKVKKIIGCLSTCIFPDNIKYPIDETKLFDGPPHDSNFSYSYAKRMLEIQSEAYRKQYGSKIVNIIPTNIYGPNDNFSLKNGHVVPCLIHKCYLSKEINKSFEVLGTGKPLRQFLYSEDLAKIIMIILDKEIDVKTIIISPKEEISIKELAETIYDSYQLKTGLFFNKSYSDGQYKKTACNDLLINKIGNFKFTPLNIGIKKTIEWFVNNYPNIRK